MSVAAHTHTCSVCFGFHFGFQAAPGARDNHSEGFPLFKSGRQVGLQWELYRRTCRPSFGGGMQADAWDPVGCAVAIAPTSVYTSRWYKRLDSNDSGILPLQRPSLGCRSFVDGVSICHRRPRGRPMSCRTCLLFPSCSPSPHPSPHIATCSTPAHAETRT